MEFELQAAVYRYMQAQAALLAMVSGVYDHVPQNERGEPAVAFPYVTIGEDVITNNDCDTHYGVEATLTIHVWSRAEGRAECKRVQGAIRAALQAAQLDVAGWLVDATHMLQSSSHMDPDGQTRHGVQTIRVTAWQAKERVL